MPYHHAPWSIRVAIWGAWEVLSNTPSRPIFVASGDLPHLSLLLGYETNNLPLYRYEDSELGSDEGEEEEEDEEEVEGNGEEAEEEEGKRLQASSIRQRDS